MTTDAAPRRRRRIFISYRRNDAQGHAGRLADNLASAFEERAVYIDTESDGDKSPRAEILYELRRCKVILIVIGPDWATLRRAGADRPRILEDDDIVAFEVRHAIQQWATGAVIYIVRVGDAPMPSPSEVPADIAEIFDTKAEYRRPKDFPLRPAHWKKDFRALKWAIFWQLIFCWPLREAKDVLVSATAASVVMGILGAGLVILRSRNPLYPAAESQLPLAMGAAGIIAAASAFLWKSALFKFKPRNLWMAVASFSILAFGSYATYASMAPMTVVQLSNNGSLYCGADYFTQPFGNSGHDYRQGPVIHVDNKCKEAFRCEFQEITLQPGLNVDGATLTIDAAKNVNGNSPAYLDALLAPAPYRAEVPGVDSDPPRQPQQILHLSQSTPIPKSFVVRFRVGSSDTKATVTVALKDLNGALIQEKHVPITFSRDYIDACDRARPGGGGAAPATQSPQHH